MPTAPLAYGTPPRAGIPASHGGDSVPALTARGRAACHLTEFQDAWAELTAEDRAWFAHWLTELLVDAVLPETA